MHACMHADMTMLLLPIAIGDTEVAGLGAPIVMCGVGGLIMISLGSQWFLLWEGWEVSFYGKRDAENMAFYLAFESVR